MLFHPSFFCRKKSFVTAPSILHNAYWVESAPAPFWCLNEWVKPCVFLQEEPPVFLHGRGGFFVPDAVWGQTLPEEREHETAQRGIPGLCFWDLPPGTGIPGHARGAWQPGPAPTLLPRLPEEGGHAECSGNSARWVLISELYRIVALVHNWNTFKMNLFWGIQSSLDQYISFDHQYWHQLPF